MLRSLGWPSPSVTEVLIEGGNLDTKDIMEGRLCKEDRLSCEGRD